MRFSKSETNGEDIKRSMFSAFLWISSCCVCEQDYILPFFLLFCFLACCLKTTTNVDRNRQKQVKKKKIDKTTHDVVVPLVTLLHPHLVAPPQTTPVK